VSITVGYRWHLRRLMADADMFATTDLVPLLAERGINLSREQVYRLVVHVPQRLSLPTLAALCDILGCGPSDLVEPCQDRAGRAMRRPQPEKTPPPRPKRARILPGGQGR
jgi:DNA-binding Xre family transcriptional regulator